MDDGETREGKRWRNCNARNAIPKECFAIKLCPKAMAFFSAICIALFAGFVRGANIMVEKVGNDGLEL